MSTGGHSTIDRIVSATLGEEKGEIYRSHLVSVPCWYSHPSSLLLSCSVPLAFVRSSQDSLSRSLSTLLVPRMYLATVVVHHALALPSTLPPSLLSMAGCSGLFDYPTPSYLLFIRHSIRRDLGFLDKRE